MADDTNNTLDLRAFLDAVSTQGPSHYRTISREISPKWEMTAVAAKLAEKLRFPVLRFDNVSGSSMPVVTNICSSLERVAKTLGTTRDDLERRFIDAAAAPIPPVVLQSSEAPVRTHVVTDDLDLVKLPQITYTDTQSAPYLTAVMIVARDPDTGAHNLSFHRLMIDSAQTAAIYMTPSGHLEQIWRKNRDQGRATQIAAVIGMHPLWSYASLCTGGLGDEDYDAVGSVLGAPLEVVPCLSDTELLVPARSEIVLEGRISHEREILEGPFGEFLGFVAKPAQRPAIEFSCMSTRDEPIFQDIVAGRIEHLTLSSSTLRARLERGLLEDNPGITGIWLPAALTMFLSIDLSKQPDLDPVALMKNLLTKDKYLKQVICFDDDIDLRKQANVQHALACHVQADRDVIILSELKGNGIDPSERDGKTAKIGINAMTKKATVPNRLPPGILETIDLNEWLD